MCFTFLSIWSCPHAYSWKHCCWCHDSCLQLGMYDMHRIHRLLKQEICILEEKVLHNTWWKQDICNAVAECHPLPNITSSLTIHVGEAVVAQTSKRMSSSATKSSNLSSVEWCSLYRYIKMFSMVSWLLILNITVMLIIIYKISNFWILQCTSVHSTCEEVQVCHLEELRTVDDRKLSKGHSILHTVSCWT